MDAFDKNMNDLRVAVLVPCYNEAATVGNVVRDFRGALPDATVYVCDNCSSDNTAAVAAAAGAVVIEERIPGKGCAVRTLFRKVDADIYLLVDGDDTYPAQNAPEMVARVASRRADMVVGDRLSSSYFSENKRTFHNSGNRLVRFLINQLFNVRLNDILSGYRVFSRDFVRNFPVMSNGFEIETEMTVHALERGYPIAEVIVDYRDRPAGSVSKLSTFSDGRRVLTTLMLLFRDYRPMTFFSIVSAICLVVGLAFFLPVVVEYWETGLVPRFPTLIVSCFILLFAMLLFFVGLLLDVVKRNNDRMWRLRQLDS